MAPTKQNSQGVWSVSIASQSQALQDLAKLVNNKELSNVSFLCQDKKVIYADKALLAARCDHFRTLLFGSMKEVSQEQIPLPDVQSSHLEAVVEFLYTGKISLSSCPEPEFVMGVYQLSRRYLIDELRDELLSEKIHSFLEFARVGEYLRLAAQVTNRSAYVNSWYNLSVACAIHWED